MSVVRTAQVQYRTIAAVVRAALLLSCPSHRGHTAVAEPRLCNCARDMQNPDRPCPPRKELNSAKTSVARPCCPTSSRRQLSVQTNCMWTCLPAWDCVDRRRRKNNTTSTRYELPLTIQMYVSYVSRLILDRRNHRPRSSMMGCSHSPPE